MGKKKIYVNAYVEVEALALALKWCEEERLRPRSLSEVISLFLVGRTGEMDEEDAIGSLLRLKADVHERVVERGRVRKETVTLRRAAEERFSPLREEVERVVRREMRGDTTEEEDRRKEAMRKYMERSYTIDDLIMLGKDKDEGELKFLAELEEDRAKANSVESGKKNEEPKRDKIAAAEERYQSNTHTMTDLAALGKMKTDEIAKLRERDKNKVLLVDRTNEESEA